MSWIFAGGILAVAAVFLIIIIRDSNRFVKVTYRIQDRKIKKKTRFVLLADLHNKEYGKQNEKLLAAIEEVSPDAVLIAGDLITSARDDAEKPAAALLKVLSAQWPVYYGNGNHEYRVFHQPENYGNTGARYRHAVRSTKACHLEDANVLLAKENIRIYGLDIPIGFFRKFKEPQLGVREIRKRLGKADRDNFTVLLAHNPVWFEDYAEWGADLTLSGHVHGGVVRLPFLGGVLSTSFRLFPKYDGGYFEKNGRKMIISRGLGAHTIPLRMLNPAELVVLELLPEE